MYSGTLNTLNYYGTSMESVESRDETRFSHPAVKQLEDGSYVANDIDIKGEDALSYYDRMTLISEAGIYDSGFLGKLRELSVSYPIWDKNGINVNLNVFARNIILWSELKGLDPEASQGNNNMGDWLRALFYAGCFELWLRFKCRNSNKGNQKDENFKISQKN